jgi:hypothetical protein
MRWPGWILIGGVLSAATLVSSRSIPAEPRIVLDRQIFERDTTIQAEHVVVAADAKIRVKNGAHLEIKAKVLEFTGTAFIDGRGERGGAGAAGKTPAAWTSCNRCGPSAGDGCHKEWERSGSAAEDAGGPGVRGADGGPGARIDIEFDSVRGAPHGIRRVLTYDISGGEAGTGGPPGKGRELRCGCHPSEVKRGPDGARGPDGKAGKAGSMRWGPATRPNRPARPNPPFPLPGPPAPVPLPQPAMTTR